MKNIILIMLRNAASLYQTSVISKKEGFLVQIGSINRFLNILLAWLLKETTA